MDIVELGQIFKSARLAANQTQTDIADSANVSLTTVSRFEQGKLLEIGTVKLLAMFACVNLTLSAQPTVNASATVCVSVENPLDEDPPSVLKSMKFPEFTRPCNTAPGGAPAMASP